MTEVDYMDVLSTCAWLRGYIRDVEGSDENLRVENVDAMVFREGQQKHPDLYDMYDIEHVAELPLTRQLRRVIDAVSKWSGHAPNTYIRNLIVAHLAMIYPAVDPGGPHNSHSNEPVVGPQVPRGPHNSYSNEPGGGPQNSRIHDCEHDMVALLSKLHALCC